MFATRAIGFLFGVLAAISLLCSGQVPTMSSFEMFRPHNIIFVGGSGFIDSNSGTTWCGGIPMCT